MFYNLYYITYYWESNFGTYLFFYNFNLNLISFLTIFLFYNLLKCPNKHHAHQINYKRVDKNFKREDKKCKRGDKKVPKFSPLNIIPLCLFSSFFFLLHQLYIYFSFLHAPRCKKQVAKGPSYLHHKNQKDRILMKVSIPTFLWILLKVKCLGTHIYLSLPPPHPILVVGSQKMCGFRYMN